jgi:predicted NAD/FAD-dependent oxidoreductase
MSRTLAKLKAMPTIGKVLIIISYDSESKRIRNTYQLIIINTKFELIKMTKLADLETQNSEPDSLLDFAVIGAGIAGLTAASEISRRGYKLAVFEKARGTGGRLSSKRVADDDGQFMAFDIGCVSMTGASEKFSKQLRDWHLKGVIEPWWKDDQELTHYVAVPRNSALTRYLSKNLACHFSTQVSSIKIIDNIWHLFTYDDVGEKLLVRARNVIIATPSPQAFDLLPAGSHLKRELEKVEVGAQWVMGLELDNTLSSAHPILYPNSDIIFSISQESRKPKRRDNLGHGDHVHGSTILQIQATSDWTRQHLESTHEQVSSALLEELKQHVQPPIGILNSYVHRWLYSCVVAGLDTSGGYLWNEDGLGLIGDYLSNNAYGVESAWLSGKQLADWLTLTNAVENVETIDR